MIFLAEGETASWTVTTDAAKDAHLIEVLVGGMWLGDRSGSSIEVGGLTLASAGQLIERFDASYGPRSGLDATIHAHVNDLLHVAPGDGIKIVDVRVTYTDHSVDTFQQDITVDRAPVTAYTFFLRTEPHGGYLRYYEVSDDATRATLEYGDGTSITADLPTLPEGLLWLERSDEPIAVHILDEAGNRSPDVLAGVRGDTFAAPHTDLVPWALPPYIKPLGAGFGALLRAVERNLNMEPESAGELMSPTTSRGRYLDAIGTLFGVTRGANERDEDLRTRVFAAIRVGKATPEGLTAILTDLFDVPVQVIDHNTDASIAPGTFLVYLFATPRQGLPAAARIVRAYRAAGFAPTLSLTFNPHPALALNPRVAGAHAHVLKAGAHARRIDGTWQLDGTVPLHAIGLQLLSRSRLHTLDGTWQLDGTVSLGPSSFVSLSARVLESGIILSPAASATSSSAAVAPGGPATLAGAVSTTNSSAGGVGPVALAGGASATSSAIAGVPGNGNVVTLDGEPVTLDGAFVTLTPPTSSLIAGSGSSSDTLTTYPKTGSVTAGDLFVDPAASAGGTGTEADPLNDIQAAHDAATAGQTILVKAGNLTPATRIIVSKAVNIYNYGTTRPLLDGSSLGTGSAGRLFTVTASGTHIKGFEIINADGDGGPCYTDVAGVEFEDMRIHDCLGGGVYFYGTGVTSGTVKDVVVWKLGDGVTQGTNVADGIVVTGGASNVKPVRCVTIDCPDDGFDFIDSTDVHPEDCIAIRPGYYWNGTAGNTSVGDGNGFKMGGATGSGGGTAKGCLVVDARGIGFAHNGADVGVTFESVTNINAGYVGIDLGGDDAVVNTAINSINHAGASVYEGASAVSSYCTWNDPADAGGDTDFPIADPVFSDPANGDYSLGAGSPCLGAASDNGNLGASTVALDLGFEWLNQVVT